MLFKSYAKAKAEHPNIDTWLSASVYQEYPLEAEEILAESTCNNSELVWEDPQVFEQVGLVINGREPIPEVHQPLSVSEIVKTVAMLKMAYPEDHFNDAVASYIAAALLDEGFAIAPKILSFVQAKIPIINLDPIQREVLEAKLRGL